LKCGKCGLEEDRDIIAVKNTRGMQELPFAPKANDRRGKGMKANTRPERLCSNISHASRRQWDGGAV